MASFFYFDLHTAYLLFGVVSSLSSIAVIGAFSNLQKKALLGDAIAHALLPGIVLGFMFAGVKALLPLTMGSFISGMVALLLIDKLPGYTRLKKDTTIALISSFFLGLGLFLLTYIQHKADEEQAGLENFLLGNIASLKNEDIMGFILVGVLLLCVLGLFFNEWRLFCFDPQFAQSTGAHIRYLNFLFRSLTVLTIVLGVQTVGVVLIAAIFIMPATAARFWQDRLAPLLVMAAIFASIAGITGVLISYTWYNVPTGPSIVLVSMIITLVSFLFAPTKGFVAKWWAHYQYHQKIVQENILKLFYELGEEQKNHAKPYTLDVLMARRRMHLLEVRRNLRKLCKKKYLTKQEGGGWCLTDTGKVKGKSILKRHLLWEAYLTKYLKIQPNHVHDDAEAMEHLITPEIESLLTNSLKGAAKE